jgi:hypothetical protein
MKPLPPLLWHGLLTVPPARTEGLPRCGVLERIVGRPVVAGVARSGDRATTREVQPDVPAAIVRLLSRGPDTAPLA